MLIVFKFERQLIHISTTETSIPQNKEAAEIQNHIQNSSIFMQKNVKDLAEIWAKLPVRMCCSLWCIRRSVYDDVILVESNSR